ncbi:hypothetical protein GcM3_197031, partial [Golovinomyces cichoracearum]
MGSDYEQREVLILSRQNHEKWFRKVEFKSKSKGYFYVAYTTKANFAWIKREVGLSTITKEEAEFQNESFRSAYPDRTLFLIFAKTLPSTYSAILDSFRGIKWTVEEKLNILIEKEGDSRAHEKAHPAFGRSHYQQQRRNSDVTMRDTSDSFAAIEYAIALREKDEKKSRKRGTTNLKSDKMTKREKKKKIPKRNRITNKGRHGYTAYGETSDSSSHEFTSNDSSEKEPKSDSDSPQPQPQKVMLTKELISKSTPAAWVPDIGATSPMTDQSHLFRGNLKKIYSTTIQVGGGTLKSSHRGTVVVKCADGSSGIAKD